MPRPLPHQLPAAKFLPRKFSSFNTTQSTGFHEANTSQSPCLPRRPSGRPRRTFLLALRPEKVKLYSPLRLATDLFGPPLERAANLCPANRRTRLRRRSNLRFVQRHIRPHHRSEVGLQLKSYGESSGRRPQFLRPERARQLSGSGRWRYASPWFSVAP